MTYCERCHSETQVLSMSWFNTQMICPRCESIESRHPKFKEAKQADQIQVLKGNYNFKGIGLPNELKK